MAEIRYFAAGSNIELIQARMYADNIDIHEGELDGNTFNPPHRLRPCLRFQWQKSTSYPNYNWVDIPGEIQDRYNVSDNAMVHESGAYRCRMDLGTSYTENGVATDDGCEVRYTDPYVVAIIDCNTNQPGGVIEAFSDTVLMQGVIIHHPNFVIPVPVLEAEWVRITSSALDCVMTPADGLMSEVDCSGWELTADAIGGSARRGRMRITFFNSDYECVFALTQSPATPTAPPLEDGNRRPTCGLVNNGPVIRGSELIFRATVADPDGDPVGAEWYDEDGTFIAVHNFSGGQANAALSGSAGSTPYTTSRGQDVMIGGSVGTVNGIPFSVLGSNQLAMTIAGTPGTTITFTNVYIRRSVTRGPGNVITSSTFSINGEYRYDSNTGTYSGPMEDFIAANGSTAPSGARTNIGWTGFTLPMRLTNPSGDVLLVNSLNGGVYTRQNNTGTWTFDTNSDIDYSGTPSLDVGNGIRGGGRLYTWTATMPSDDEDITRLISVEAVDYEDTVDYVIKSSLECGSTGSWMADPGASAIGRIDNYITPSLTSGDTNSRELPPFNLGLTQSGARGSADFTANFLNDTNNFLFGVGSSGPAEGRRVPNVGDTIEVINNTTQAVVDSRQVSAVLNGVDVEHVPGGDIFINRPPSLGNGWSFRVAGGDRTWRNNARQAVPFGNNPAANRIQLQGITLDNSYEFTVLDAAVQMAFYQGTPGTQYNPFAPSVDMTLHIVGPTNRTITLRTASQTNGGVRVSAGTQHNDSVVYDTNALVRFMLEPGTYGIWFTSTNPIPGIPFINGLYYEVIGGTGVNAEARSLNETRL